MGMMTRDDLMRLLMLQADRRRPLTEILVEQGALSEQKAAAEMAAYRRAQARSNRTITTHKIVPARHGTESAHITSAEFITV
jgi:hypothetical protein